MKGFLVGEVFDVNYFYRPGNFSSSHSIIVVALSLPAAPPWSSGSISSSHTPSKGSGRVHHQHSCLVSDGKGSTLPLARRPARSSRPRLPLSSVSSFHPLPPQYPDLLVCHQSGTSVPDD